jgi:ParB family chromosome partitioning protein
MCGWKLAVKRGNQMTTASAKTDVAAGPEKTAPEKVEKRRALGRGLDALLPGPRVVSGTAAPKLGLGVGEAGIGNDAGRGTGVSALHGPSGASEPTATRDVPDNVEVRSEEMNGDATGSSGDAGSRTGVSGPHDPASDEVGGTIPDLQAQAGRMPGNLVVQIPLDHIDQNPYQTRYLFDHDLLEELAFSIRENGVLQPIVVRPAEEEGRYILILGERRCRASRLLKNATIPAIVRRVSNQQAAEMTIVENLQREDLNCMEQAEAFRVLSKEFNLTQSQIGDRVGLSRESVSNYMRLLKLPEEIMTYLSEGRMGFSEARELLRLSKPEQIPEAAEYIMKKRMSVEQIEDMVRRMEGQLPMLPGLPGQEKKKVGSRWVDPNVRAAQLELERTLGLRVRIRDRKGRGRIMIDYSTVDDYERVVGLLRK